MTYAQCEAQLIAQLQHLYDAGEASAIADLVLEEYTDKNRHQRRLVAQLVLGGEPLLQIQAATRQLLLDKPVQYVLGCTVFYEHRYRINESVLIPRPETEELIDWVIKDTAKKQIDLQILDIGTGSGCIAVAINLELPKAALTAIDCSAAAIETASWNAHFHEAEVRLLEIDFLQENNWQQLGRYDVIVSNPPYIPWQEAASMSRHVTDWEPATALFVPNEKPLLFYEKIVLFGKTHLHDGGAIYLEAHKDFASDVQQLFAQQGYTAELRKDMHGNERMIRAVRRES